MLGLGRLPIVSACGPSILRDRDGGETGEGVRGLETVARLLKEGHARASVNGEIGIEATLGSQSKEKGDAIQV